MMKVKPALFSSLLMTFVALVALWRGQTEFAVNVDVDKRLGQMAARVDTENIKNQMLVARFQDFQQEVAMNLPDVKVLESQKAIREIASVIPHTSGDPKLELRSQKRLEGVRAVYNAKKFDDAVKESQELISQFPESSAQLEASYYLISSYYQTGNKQEALNWTEKMLAQFPESGWTAKSLLVMADIYKEQGRKNDLLDVYQILLDTFNKDEDIKSDVKKRLSSLEM